MLVGLLGSLLGILMMIPLRRALIVAQHGQLKYPEGTACAQVLKAGACAESRAVAEKVGSVPPAPKAFQPRPARHRSETGQPRWHKCLNHLRRVRSRARLQDADGRL